MAIGLKWRVKTNAGCRRRRVIDDRPAQQQWGYTGKRDERAISYQIDDFRSTEKWVTGGAKFTEVAHLSFSIAFSVVPAMHAGRQSEADRPKETVYQEKRARVSALRVRILFFCRCFFRVTIDSRSFAFFGSF